MPRGTEHKAKTGRDPQRRLYWEIGGGFRKRMTLVDGAPEVRGYFGREERFLSEQEVQQAAHDGIEGLLASERVVLSAEERECLEDLFAKPAMKAE